MNDVILVGMLGLGAPLLLVAVISFLIHYFVALKSPPTRRAAWTAGIAYLATTAFLLTSGGSFYEVWGPVTALPAALIAFFWWRADFRRGWFGDAEDAPEDATITNDDWLIGVIQLLVLATLTFGVAYFRSFIGSLF